MSDGKRILAIVGSLRKGSFNGVLAQSAQKLLDGRADFSILEYSDVPFMNQDIEFPAPVSVDRVRAEVYAADGLWIFTPEYNRGLPAVLKNLLDWLSRPTDENNQGLPLPLVDKPVALSGVGGRVATTAARKDLLALLGFLKARPVGGEGEGFSFPAESKESGVWEPTERELARLERQATAFLASL